MNSMLPWPYTMDNAQINIQLVKQENIITGKLNQSHKQLLHKFPKMLSRQTPWGVLNATNEHLIVLICVPS